MKRRLKYLQQDYARGEVDWEEVNASVQSYLGLLRHCNSYNLRRKLFETLVFIRGGDADDRHGINQDGM
jgi:hypothetical protein